ncbi:MAG: ATP phosphoribosyltransferase regulatory subunit [Cyanobacteriota bacterium]|nr:ATP phosphoribosyltransferase regulatory subunit [Cyanobacteriota bacterium]
MALQPAAGARDLNPREVESQRWLCERLAEVYRRWGYQEVAPPTIERIDTLEAGGAIAEREVVRLVADAPLGLRPELTASIARAASTRMAHRPRPLRLWASGPTFRSFLGDGGDMRINESLQSGVELLGESSDGAEMELMHLLLTAVSSLGLKPSHQPTLLVGHHALLGALLEVVPASEREMARDRLTTFDALGIDALPIPREARGRLQALLQLRGDPRTVLYQLEQWLGQIPLLGRLETLLSSVEPLANAGGVRLQLDPTFQPHFDLYDGLVFKLVCQGQEAPVAIASGGRYDRLTARFCDDLSLAYGTGFGFSIAALQDLVSAEPPPAPDWGPWFVASSDASLLPAALERMAFLHSQGESAELCSQPCGSEEEAHTRAMQRGCRGVIWVEPPP